MAMTGFRMPAAAPAFVLALSLLAPAAAPARAQEGEVPAARAVPVEVAPVTTARVEEAVRFVGTLIPERQVDVAPSVSGIVTKVHFTDGQAVGEGDPLFQLDDRAARAEVAKARAALAAAQTTLRRQRELAVGGNAAQAVLDRAATDAASAQAALDAALTQLDLLTLRAPFAGTVGVSAVNPGAYVEVGRTLVRLVDETPLFLEVRVPQRFLPRLAAGQPIACTADAFPAGACEGTIGYIDPVVDDATRTIRVRGTIHNPSGALRPGMGVRTILRIATRDGALVVPETALVPTMTGHRVYRVADGKADAVAVEVGTRQGGRVEIRSGLSAGDRVVTLGQFQLEDGAPVTVTTAVSDGAG